MLAIDGAIVAILANVSATAFQFAPHISAVWGVQAEATGSVLSAAILSPQIAAIQASSATAVSVLEADVRPGTFAASGSVDFLAGAASAKLVGGYPGYANQRNASVTVGCATLRVAPLSDADFLHLHGDDNPAALVSRQVMVPASGRMVQVPASVRQIQF
jgi:hypothetical protein